MLVLLTAQGCGSDTGPGAFGASSGKGGNGGDEGICLLNNCDLERDCADCSDGKTICNQKEHRCIACGPDADGKKCGASKTCTKYGNCVPSGLTCAEDDKGVPTITCQNNADCGACGPKFQVCDRGAKKCVGCQQDNTTNCQSTDTCNADGTCVPKCPASCATDGDCGQCGAPGKEAHACNKHVCAQCSATVPCPDGGACDLSHGTCVKPCGLGRPGVSNCREDRNCSGCRGTTTCKDPFNGGEGVCAVPVNGCSDIGKGIVVLPEPFNDFTNACSNDADCSNVSADLNVGKILEDATGLDAIKDGSISYGMHACASVEVLDKSCGVCVPCKQDTDCVDIDVTKVAGDVFGPLGSVGATLLLDKAFGPNDHKIHMYCQNVAGDYGACLPCPNMLARCAQTSEEVPATGACDHDICKDGGPLGMQCNTCVPKVCAKDPYCCLVAWDLQCQTDVDLYCEDKTCKPDVCSFRDEGWYCFDEATRGGYHCAASDPSQPMDTAFDAGHQCVPGRICKRSGNGGPKDKALLCDTDGDDNQECPVGSKGKPRCVEQ